MKTEFVLMDLRSRRRRRENEGRSKRRKFWGRRQGFSQRWMGGLGAASLVEHLRVFQHHAHLCVAQRKLVYTSYVLRRKLAHAVRRP